MDNTAEACKDVLICPICMDSFTSPKILKCGHSLCLTPCLAEIVKDPDPVCPLCRTLIVFPPSGKIEDMITNFSVRSLIEALEKTDQTDEISSDIACHTQEHGEENPLETKIGSTSEACKDVLTCPVCMDTYTTPKILTCGHSLCLTPCLTEIAQLHDQVCPLCRSAIVFPPSGKIEDMITNFSVKSLIETLEKTDQKHRTSSYVPCHTQEYGDYICMTCLQQICSCCQLSFHIDAYHDCVSISDFKEKLGKDVSKMKGEINESRWSEQTERYTTVFSDMFVYFYLQEKISNACGEIIQSSNEKKLDLKKIKQIQKQVRKDHAKFKATWKTIEVNIRDAIGRQLAEYRQKLKGLQYPEHIYRKDSFTWAISSFENLKLETEANIESLTKQMQTESFPVFEMEEQLQNIRKNKEKAEKAMKDITRDYHNSLLGEFGLTDVVEPHHLFRIQEMVDVMNFGSNRHSKDIIIKCNELMVKFQASKDFVKETCANLVEKFNNRPFYATRAREKLVKIVEEADNCKLYYRDIYEVIGEQFILYDNSFMKHYVQHQFIARNNSYILQSTLKGKTKFVKTHVGMFESYKHTTATECKAMFMYFSEESPAKSVVHKSFQAIEIRLERTEYHCKLLTSLLKKELRCYEISRELKRLFMVEEKMTDKLLESYENNEEVQRLWEAIGKHELTTISYDVHFITSMFKRMEQERSTVVSTIMMLKSKLVISIVSLRQVMALHAQLRIFFNQLNLPLEIVKSDPRTIDGYLRGYSLKKLVTLLNKAGRLGLLSPKIHNNSAKEHMMADKTSSLMQSDFMLEGYHRENRMRHFGKYPTQAMYPLGRDLRVRSETDSEPICCCLTIVFIFIIYSLFM